MLTANVLAAPIHDPNPPVTYSAWVWVVGLALIAAIIVWYWWVHRFTRPRPAPDLPEAHWVTLREKTLKRVGYTEEQYRNGHTDLRSLHLELNTILREYSTERLGRDAMWMTAAEIGAFPGASQVAGLLSRFEEPAFSFSSDAEALAATASARQVISSW